MDLLKNMNGALKYIEENLACDMDLKEAARRALCSEYHFSKNVWGRIYSEWFHPITMNK